MPGRVRHRWMIAVAEAWPLASEGAFELATTSLVQHSTGIPDERTQRLADDLEGWLRPRAAALSIEVLRQYRDGAWFKPRRPGPPLLDVRLHEHLEGLARRYLRWDGSHVSLDTRTGADAPELAHRFRWLSLLLPVDLLTAAMGAWSDAAVAHAEVRLVTPALEQVLRRRVADTHYHVGSALRFGQVWSELMVRVAREEPDDPGLAPDPAPFGGWGAMQQRILEAAVTRLFLAGFLHGVANGGASSRFDAYLARVLPRVRLGVASRANRRMLAGALANAIRSLDAPLPPAAVGRARGLAARRTRLAYGRLLRRPASRPRSIDEIHRRDPLWASFGSRGQPPEAGFTLAALRYLREQPKTGQRDTGFERAFWQYERVRTLTYRYLTQDPGTSGLDWFQEHYDRIGSLRGDLDSLTFPSALRVDSRDAHLSASEPRATPDSSWHKVRNYVREIARHGADFPRPPGGESPEVGLIFHFLKRRESGQGSKRRLAADPWDPLYRCRFGAWYAEGLRQASAVERALRFHPELLLVLRGVDVASIEQAMPTWPVLPLLDRVRRASKRAAEQLVSRLPDWNARPVGMTLHAGEDFRRLSEGLRRIHEPIEAGIMQAGDRFGHALALGTRPEDWASGSRLVLQPREERLDDLLWELARYQGGDIPCVAGRLEMVRAEADRHARHIYGDSVTGQLDLLIDARRLRHQPAWLERLGFPRLRQRHARGPFGLLLEYLRDDGVFARGQEPIEVPSSDAEVAMLERAQRWLRGQLARMEITVEGNPSSNLVIGDLEDIESHPFFELMPLHPDDDCPLVPVSINVDNAITAATCLADEYAHTYYAMLRAGKPSPVALDWLERARKAGWESRFTLEASKDRDELRALASVWDGRRTAR